MTPVEIRIGLPPQLLYPNSRASRWPVAKAKKAYRYEAKIQTKKTLKAIAPAPRFDSAVARVTFIFPASRPGPLPDPDNAAAALKAAWDGIQDGGLLTTDRQLRILPIDLKKSHLVRVGFVRIVLEPCQQSR